MYTTYVQNIQTDDKIFNRYATEKVSNCNLHVISRMLLLSSLNFENYSFRKNTYIKTKIYRTGIFKLHTATKTDYMPTKIPFF